MKIAVGTGKSFDFIAKGNGKGKGNTKTFGIKFSDVEELTKDLDSRLLFCTECSH